MFLLQLGKEIKVFFTGKGNILFMFLMPILLITVFSFALRDYMGGEYGTFDDGRVFYYVEGITGYEEEFESISTRISDSLGIDFEQVSDYEKACRDTESGKAYGVIRITDDGFDYFRSSFNEPEGGKIVRTVFVQMAGDHVYNDEAYPVTYVSRIRLEVNRFESKNYYTFAGLAFSILFMALLVAFMVYDEREYGTIERIRLSNAGISGMILSKALTGIICGMVMIGASYLYSRIVLKVNWGEKAVYIIAILSVLVVFSSTFGCVIGLIGKNRTMCQSMVMMFSMLCGYLGGSITPLYLLENVPVLNWIIRLSPLYYVNRAVTSLYNGIVDEKTAYSILVLSGLTVLLVMAGIGTGKKVRGKV